MASPIGEIHHQGHLRLVHGIVAKSYRGLQLPDFSLRRPGYAIEGILRVALQIFQI